MKIQSCYLPLALLGVPRCKPRVNVHVRNALAKEPPYRIAGKGLPPTL